VAVQQPFIDIHCHLLPHLDDGAKSWEDALAMARMAAADGIAAIVCTVHQLGNYAQNTGEQIRAGVTQFQQLLDAHQVPLQVLPGADVRIEPEMVRKLASGEVLSLADRRRYVLLELPHELYLPLDRVLGELHSVGMIGILSHPERNLGILANPQVLVGLVQAGCLLQVTAGSLMGTFGPASQGLAEWIIAHGLAHFIATDAHGVKSRRPLLSRACQRVAELAGRQTAEDLCCRHPAMVVENRIVPRGIRKVVRPPAARKSWFGWLKTG
jgi:protein-tyrosine phosphatase